MLHSFSLVILFTLSRFISLPYLNLSAPRFFLKRPVKIRSLLPFPWYVKERLSGPLLASSGRFVEIKGLEPSTYGLQSRRSSQLSYIPNWYLRMRILRMLVRRT